MISALRSVLKRVLVRVAPRLYFARSISKIHARDLEFMERHGACVHGGPFAGTHYVRSAICSSYLPKLIGSYESELHRVLEVALNNPYVCVIDVGCAEGFYAVGMARRLQNATVYAHDTSYEARALCRAMARLNHVQNRVLVRGECTPQRLQMQIPNGRTLVIADCEGYEKILLDPRLAPQLLQCDILVELHDFLDSEISRVLEARFCDSHLIEIIDTQERQIEDYKVIADWPHAVRQWALEEGRPTSMQWAWMVAKSNVVEKNSLDTSFQNLEHIGLSDSFRK